MKLILPVLLLALLGGCASDKKESKPAPQGESMWRLTFDKRLEQNDFAAPILNVDFGDETFPFYLNTASTSHTIDMWAAQAIKLPSKEGVIVADTEIDDDRLTKMSFNVAKQNSRFEASGVAGWLVPQLLVGSDGAVAADFLNSKFYRGKFADLLNARDATLITPETGKVCVGANGAPSMYVLIVKIDDIPMKLLIDSAAEDTTLKEDHPAAKKLSKDGKTKFSKLHRGRVNVGGKTVTRLVDIKPLPNLPCDAEGVLGMDVLKLCSVVMDQQQVGINCITD